jgi:hypothetical protein
LEHQGGRCRVGTALVFQNVEEARASAALRPHIGM